MNIKIFVYIFIEQNGGQCMINFSKTSKIQLAKNAGILSKIIPISRQVLEEDNTADAIKEQVDSAKKFLSMFMSICGDSINLESKYIRKAITDSVVMRVVFVKSLKAKDGKVVYENPDTKICVDDVYDRILKCC